MVRVVLPRPQMMRVQLRVLAIGSGITGSEEYRDVSALYPRLQVEPVVTCKVDPVSKSVFRFRTSIIVGPSRYRKLSRPKVYALL